jgi:hypothetical protein
MADEPQTSAGATGGKGVFKDLSRSALKRTLAPLAATAATAGTAYLTRKATQIWNESVLPKVREKGGGKPFAKDALEQAARKLPGDRGSGLLGGLAERLGDQQAGPASGGQHAAQSRSESGQQSGGRRAGGAETDPKREQQRRERQRRREQRERSLQQTRST